MDQGSSGQNMKRTFLISTNPSRAVPQKWKGGKKNYQFQKLEDFFSKNENEGKTLQIMIYYFKIDFQ